MSTIATRKSRIGFVVGVVLALSLIVGCTSARNKALERHAIWTEMPGVPLERDSDGVYFARIPSGATMQVIVSDGKIVGVSCAEKCSSKAEAPPPAASRERTKRP